MVQAEEPHAGVVERRIDRMEFTLRAYQPEDFAALHRLDQSCFPAGIAYSKTTLRYFLNLACADCIIAMEGGAMEAGAMKGGRIAGFILTEENAPLAHVITLDVAEKYRRQGVGSALLAESERNLARRDVRHVLLETAVDNEAAVAFWQRHGYRIEATLKRYYLRQLDAYEMRKILTAPRKGAPAASQHGPAPVEKSSRKSGERD